MALKLSLVCFAIFGLASCSEPVSFNDKAIGYQKTIPGDNNQFSPPAPDPVDPDPTPGTLPPPPEDDPKCIVDLSQVYLQGNINAFEFTGGGGLSFGYTPSGNNSGVSVDARLHVDMARMDLTMLGSDPLTGATIASTTVGSNYTNTKVDADINFQEFKATPSMFFSTPLAKVTLKGLDKALAELKKQTIKTPWMASVSKILSDNQVLVNAGERAGIQPGDSLAIYKVEHYWQGTACESPYLGNQMSDSPVATITMLKPSPGSMSSVGVVNGKTDGLKRGYVVMINKLSGNSSRFLKKKALLGLIRAHSFNVPGGDTFDFGWAINYQIMDSLNRSDAFVFELAH